jgi:hypothetical protein
MATAAERRAAQRRLARDLREGRQILPPSTTKKARAVVSDRKSELVNRIARAKRLLHSGQEGFSGASSRKHITHDKQGNARSLDDIRNLAGIYTRAIEDDDYDFHEDLVEIDMEDADWYH